MENITFLRISLQCDETTSPWFSSPIFLEKEPSAIHSKWWKIELLRISLQCLAPERGWRGYFYTFAVFLSTITWTWRHCLECENRRVYLERSERHLLLPSFILKNHFAIKLGSHSVKHFSQYPGWMGHTLNTHFYILLFYQFMTKKIKFMLTRRWQFCYSRWVNHQQT